MDCKKKTCSRRRCKVSNCRNTTSENVKLFSLPKEGLRREVWLQRMQVLTDVNESNHVGRLFVCSLHFVSGKPSGEFHKTSVDWAPSLHLQLKKPEQLLVNEQPESDETIVSDCNQSSVVHAYTSHDTSSNYQGLVTSNIDGPTSSSAVDVPNITNSFNDTSNNGEGIQQQSDSLFHQQSKFTGETPILDNFVIMRDNLSPAPNQINTSENTLRESESYSRNSNSHIGEDISRNGHPLQLSAVDQVTELMQQISVLKEHLRISEEKLVTANDTILEVNLQLCASNNRIASLESFVQQRPTISRMTKI